MLFRWVTAFFSSSGSSIVVFGGWALGPRCLDDSVLLSQILLIWIALNEFIMHPYAHAPIRLNALH